MDSQVNQFRGMNMKIRIFALYILLISIILPILVPSVVYAAVNVPDDEFSIETVRSYRNALELDDLFILVDYNILYTTGTPTDYTAQDLFNIRMFDDATYIDNKEIYSYGNINDYGFCHGLASFYFSASDVENLGFTWGDDYTFVLSGNPLIDWATGTPPSVSKTGFDAEFDGNSYSNIDTQIRVRIGDFAREFESDWELSPNYLVDWSTGDPTLTYYGETYFGSVIDNLSGIAPSLFGASVDTVDWIEPDSYIAEYCSGTKTDVSYPIWNNTVTGTENRAGQWFNATNTTYIDSVTSLFTRTGSGCGIMTASIYNSLNGSPSGTALCYGTLDTSTWSTSEQFHTFNFGTPAKILEDSEYCIVFSAGTGNATNLINSRWNDGNCCDNGNSIWFSGGSWSQYTQYDIPYTLTVYETMYSDEQANDIKDTGLFKIRGSGDIFNMTDGLVAFVIALIVLLVIMVKARNQGGTTRNVFIFMCLGLVGISLILPIGLYIISGIASILLIITLHNLFFRTSGA